MAHLGACPRRAAVDLAPEYQAAADPGADGQQHEVLAPLRDPAAMLGEGVQVGVVVERDRQAEPLLHEIAQWHVDEGQVHGRDREPALAVDRAGNPEADGAGIRVLAESELDLGLQPRQDRFCRVAVTGLRRPVEDVRVGVHDSDQHLRPA
jgi:hypothetical protein